MKLCLPFALSQGALVNQSAGELPLEAAKPPTSLHVETGSEWSRAQLLATILIELEGRYDGWQRLHTVVRRGVAG